MFQRSDGGDDPPEWVIEDHEHRSRVALAAVGMIEHIDNVPGTRPDGSIDAEELLAWVEEVRRLCVLYGRGEIGEEYIGRVLSNAPSEKDGTWPCRPVCVVMESISSRSMGAGFDIGVHNARSRRLRGEDIQDRELAVQYRGWAGSIAAIYPHVSSVLERIASRYEEIADHMTTDWQIRNRLENS